MTDPFAAVVVGLALAGWAILLVVLGACVTLAFTEPRARVAETPDEDPRGGSE